MEKHVYPALLGMAKFLLKTLKPDGEGHLLADPSASPENRHNGLHYKTVGCTFDQAMIWECFRDLIEAARVLKIKNPVVKEVEEKIQLLDPITIGEDGQLKEYREEKRYSDIGDPGHRHISHLCAVYPGTLINGSTPEWMKAAGIALQKRGDSSRMRKGWPAAHRMNAWARLKEGNQAHSFYDALLTYCITENLWDICPPYVIDGNLGGTSGVAEMLLQSHENCIEPLPALPDVWAEGKFSGLVARGNFEVSVQWSRKQMKTMSVISKNGEVCRIKYPSVSKCVVTDLDGHVVKVKTLNDDMIEFKTRKGLKYSVNFN